MIKTAAKKLTTIENLIGTVIAEIKFRRGIFEPETKILKSAHRLTMIKISLPAAQIFVKLIKCRENFVPPELPEGTQNFFWRKFTPEEVYKFVEEVGDKNEIHRTKLPIVPGFLIFESLIQSPEFSTCKSLTAKFEKFTLAGEGLNLKIDGNKFEIFTATERKIIGESEV